MSVLLSEKIDSQRVCLTECQKAAKLLCVDILIDNKNTVPILTDSRTGTVNLTNIIRIMSVSFANE